VVTSMAFLLVPKACSSERWWACGAQSDFGGDWSNVLIFPETVLYGMNLWMALGWGFGSLAVAW